MAKEIHLDLDGGWGDSPLGLPTCDARVWGPRLRFIAPRGEVEAFAREVVAGLPAMVLYGSGDFHHLTATFIARLGEPVTVISFDNHPDWDIRPPRWACGGWVDRAMRLAVVKRAAVWGCGNFEVDWPGRWSASREARVGGRLEVFPWAERVKASTRKRFACIGREDWRERFARFADGLAGEAVYVTVDLDCLTKAEAVTNWENGLFTADDIAWAIGQLGERCRLAGADVCGGWSELKYGRWWQRFAGGWDHPRQTAAVSEAEARRVNLASVGVIWAAIRAAADGAGGHMKTE